MSRFSDGQWTRLMGDPCRTKMTINKIGLSFVLSSTLNLGAIVLTLSIRLSIQIFI